MFAAVVVFGIVAALLSSPCPEPVPSTDPTVVTTHYLPPRR